HYKGKPRHVRIWDEEILPSVILTPERTRILRLVSDFGPINTELGEAIEGFCNKLRTVNDGELIEEVPVLFDKYGIDLQTARAAVSDEDKDTVEALFGLQGKPARTSKDKDGTTTLRYDDYLPDDLAPMVILDASGQQRATYELWKKDRGNLEI